MVKLKSMDKIDQDTILYQQGFQAGVEHQKMSPETAKHFNDLRAHNEQMYKMIENMHTFMFGVPEENNNGGLKKTVEEILIQAKKTNGRVNKLEEDKAIQSGWIKGLSVVTVIVTMIVLPSISYFILKFNKLNEQVLTLTVQNK